MKNFSIYNEDGNITLNLNIDVVDSINFDTINLIPKKDTKPNKQIFHDVDDFLDNLFASQEIENVDYKAVTRIIINSESGNIIKSESLAFLKEYFSHVNILSLNNFTYDNLSILYNLENLEKIGFSGIVNSKVDFTRLPKLRKIFAIYNINLASIFECENLEELELHKFSEKTSAKFTRFINLKKLILRRFKMLELNTFNNLPKLEYLEISHNRMISDLSSLQNNNTIKELNIMNCPKVNDFSVLSNLKNLEVLILENQKEIQTLSFIKDMPNLKRIGIIGTSSVLDGKLKWLLDIAGLQLGGEIRKHYDIKWVEGKEGDRRIAPRSR